MTDTTHPDRELEITIAKARGWRVEQHEHLFGGYWYRLIMPDGTAIFPQYGWDVSEEVAWREYGPRYLTDANAIRELMVEMFRKSRGNIGVIYEDSHLLELFIEGNYATICRWWLTLQERKP